MLGCCTSVNIRRSLVGFLSVAVLALTSCQSNDNKVITHFLKYPKHFDEIVNAAYKDFALLNQMNELVGYEKLDDRTKKALQKIGLPQIHFITLRESRCQNISEMEIEILFDKNWHLQYEPCREVEFTTGEYNEVGFIESWEVDKNWYVWVNNDFIG